MMKGRYLTDRWSFSPLVNTRYTCSPLYGHLYGPAFCCRWSARWRPPQRPSSMPGPSASGSLARMPSLFTTWLPASIHSCEGWQHHCSCDFHVRLSAHAHMSFAYTHRTFDTRTREQELGALALTTNSRRSTGSPIL